MQRDENIVIQGELYEGRMFASSLRLPMRPALAAGGRSYGYAETACVLGSLLSPSSREDLRELAGRFPAAVIEFSAYSRKVGVLPHRNTLIWEVREY
jgi:hypothetical protein